MQNRYVADVGDFGKYGLLKGLCLASEADDRPVLALGVVWYLVPDEVHNDDGKHIRYLEPSPRNQNTYRNCDPLLYDALRKVILTGARDVKSIREHQILPPETTYYEVPLSFDGITGSGSAVRSRRLSHRSAWLRNALEMTAKCDIVFVDPDNGLEVKVKPYQKLGPKYTFFNELVPYLRRKQSVVIYHHIGRTGTALDQVQIRLAHIRERLGGEYNTFALLYHRGSARAFFIVPSPRHKRVVLHRAKRFLEGPWSRHFELVSLTP